jgi:transcriptional regulator with XRE-family HTH domain
VTSDQARRLAQFHLDIAHALYRARERSGVSIDELAERSGLSPDRVLTIEEGDTTSLTEVAQICDGLGVSVVAVMPDLPSAVNRYEGVTRVA